MALLEELDRVLALRKQDDPKESYVASLYAGGVNKILEKVGEEAAEVIIAAKDADASSDTQLKEDLVKEVADLWFHTLVLLAHQDLTAKQVLDELGKRFGISGLAEKASRGK